MVKIPSEALEEAIEPRADAGGRTPQLTRDLARIQAGDVSHREEGSFVWLQAGEGTTEIEKVDSVARIGTAEAIGADGNLGDRSTSLASQQSSRLVGRNRDQPGSNLQRIAE
jgi:hypothetical protein